MQHSIKSTVVKPPDAQNSEQLVALDVLITDETLRTRATLDETLCAQWSQRMRASRDGRIVDGHNTSWPPLLVVSDGKQFWLIDGLHRLTAARLAGLQQIQCVVSSGDLKQARERALGANLHTERKRTNEDKRMVVQRALLDEAIRAMSDACVAELCGVSQPFVSKLRRKLTAAGTITPLPQRLGADGRVYQAARISGRTPGAARSRQKHTKPHTRRAQTLPAPNAASSPQPPTPPPAPAPPIIRRRDTPTQRPDLSPLALSPAPTTPTLAHLRCVRTLREAEQEPRSLRLLVVPALERRHWYDVANDGVPLLHRSRGLLVVPQTLDLPHAVCHLIRQDIQYLGLVVARDGSAWHLWGLDTSTTPPAHPDDLAALCKALNPLQEPSLVFAP
jgi:hypothetical protein